MRAAGVARIVPDRGHRRPGTDRAGLDHRRTVGAMRELRAILRTTKPDLVILIDFAEFNLMLAGIGKRAGVPVLYYITPQVWAWRRGRISKLIERADRLAVVLPFEAELLRARGRPRELSSAIRCSTGSRRPGRGLKRSRVTVCRPTPGCWHCCRAAAARNPLSAARRWSRRRAFSPSQHRLIPCIALAPTLDPARARGARPASTSTGIRIIQNDTYSIIARQRGRAGGLGYRDAGDRAARLPDGDSLQNVRR